MTFATPEAFGRGAKVRVPFVPTVGTSENNPGWSVSTWKNRTGGAVVLWPAEISVAQFGIAAWSDSSVTVTSDPLMKFGADSAAINFTLISCWSHNAPSLTCTDT